MNVFFAELLQVLYIWLGIIQAALMPIG